MLSDVSAASTQDRDRASASGVLPPGDRARGGADGARSSALAGAALGFSVAAAYVQLRALEAERKNPPTGRFLEVAGVRLHYLERGSGPPLVLLHGNGALVQDFALSGLIDLAARKYRVIVFDRPGYGYSTRPRDRLWTPEAQARLFREAFARLGLERPVVLGHSWGALVAMALGLGHPLCVRSLVLLSGYFYPTPRADIALFAPPAIPVVGDALRFTISPFVGRLIWPALIRKLFAPNPVPRLFGRFPKWMALRPGQLRAAGAEAAMMIPAAARLSRRYHRLGVPTMIVAGEGDLQVTTKRHSAALHRELPQTRLRVIPQVGHMVHHVAPEAVLRAIDEAADMADEARRRERPRAARRLSEA